MVSERLRNAKAQSAYKRFNLPFAARQSASWRPVANGLRGAPESIGWHSFEAMVC